MDGRRGKKPQGEPSFLFAVLGVTLDRHKQGIAWEEGWPLSRLSRGWGLGDWRPWPPARRLAPRCRCAKILSRRETFSGWECVVIFEQELLVCRVQGQGSWCWVFGVVGRRQRQGCLRPEGTVLQRSGNARSIARAAEFPLSTQSVERMHCSFCTRSGLAVAGIARSRHAKPLSRLPLGRGRTRHGPKLDHSASHKR